MQTVQRELSGPPPARGSISVASSASARELFTRRDTGHRYFGGGTHPLTIDDQGSALICDTVEPNSPRRTRRSRRSRRYSRYLCSCLQSRRTNQNRKWANPADGNLRRNPRSKRESPRELLPRLQKGQFTQRFEHLSRPAKSPVEKINLGIYSIV
jgi:hypothetical protein